MGAKDKFSKYIKLFIYLIVVILINAVGLTLFFRLDLTKNKIFSLSKASKMVVSNLSEPLTINVFFTKNLPAPHNNTERYLHDLLEEYAIHANQYFNYRFYDVSSESDQLKKDSESNKDLANNYGIRPVQIQVFEKDEVKLKNAYMGLVLIHGDLVERIPTITTINGLEYKLTTAIKKLNNKVSALLSLPDNIQVKLFLSSSLQRVAPFMGLDELPTFPNKIKEIVKTINANNYGKLEYTYVDPTMLQGNETTWKKYDLMNLQWPALSNGKIAAGEGVIGLVMEHRGKVRVMPLLTVLRIPIIGTQYNLADIDQVGEMINDNIETLVDINEDLGYLAGHGTLNTLSLPSMGQQTQESMSSFNTLVAQNYTLKQVNLKQGAIPDSIKCLVIARPTEPFSDYDLYQIDQALMQGKNLAIFLDAFNEIAPRSQASMGFNQGPTFVPIKTGLEKLLEHYGVRIKTSLVMDENSHKQRVSQQFGGGERPFYFVPIIKNKFINKELDFMKNIKGLITIKISPLELDENRISENQLTVHKLFSSSERSWEMRERINLNPMFITPPPSDEEMASLPLAYLIEGEFPSYFADKPMPEKVTEPAATDEKTGETTPEKGQKKKATIDLSKIASQGAFLAKGKPSKIFLIASSEMLKDTVMDAGGGSPNAMFVMNVLDALNDREDIATMRSKEQQFNPLYESGALTKTFIKTFHIAGLPVLVALFGAVIWMRRRSRQKTIQMMFQK
ncbi:MAG: Gldg family protein [Desulfobacterales bacterium]|nr:MAG: Gldg family protein [Desulfobacterales bacterium]